MKVIQNGTYITELTLAVRTFNEGGYIDLHGRLTDFVENYPEAIVKDTFTKILKSDVANDFRLAGYLPFIVNWMKKRKGNSSEYLRRSALSTFIDSLTPYLTDGYSTQLSMGLSSLPFAQKEKLINSILPPGVDMETFHDMVKFNSPERLVPLFRRELASIFGKRLLNDSNLELVKCFCSLFCCYHYEKYGLQAITNFIALDHY